MQTAVRITLSSISPEPTYTGGPFVSGVAQLDTASPATTDWDTDYFVSCGAFGERVDIATGGNYGQLMDSEMEISNHDKWFATFSAAGASLVGAVVEIGEATSSIDMDTRWTGTVADPTFQGMNVQMRVENILATRHKTIPARTLTAQEFGAISEDGLPVPILYNAVEALTPQSVKDTQYIPGAYRVSEVGGYDAEIQGIACLGATIDSFTAPYVVATGTARYLDASYFWPTTIEDNFGIVSWYTRGAWDLEPVYVEVISGTGSGQIRKLSGIAMPGNCSSSMSATYYAVANVSSPWDTIPDTTSVLKFYRINTPEILIVGDEATVSRTYVIESEEEFNIPASQGTLSGVITSDVSGEFRNGENYNAVEYVAPIENYGSTKLTDKKSSNIPANKNTVSILPYNAGTLSFRYPLDAFCRTKIFCEEFPTGTEGKTEIDCLFSFESAQTVVNDIRMILIGEYLDGTEVVIRDAQTPITSSTGTAFSNYSPAICSDATVGNYSAYTIRISLPRPVSAFASFRACLLLPGGYGPFAQYAYALSAGVGVYTVGSTTIRLIDDVLYTISAGDKIRPYDSYNSWKLGILKATIQSSNVAYAGPYSEWRTVQSVTPVGGGFSDIVFDSEFSIPSGTYAFTAVRPAAPFQTISEIEAGFAFVFGDISPDSEFRVDVSSGRTFAAHWDTLPSGKANGDPITLARDAVLDIYYRDLGLPDSAVNFASFQALPADPIYSALTERVDSAERVASLCQQFNWVIGHDGDGRETAFAWLSRVGSTDYDLSIDTGDVVEGTLTGVAMTDILDLVNLPNVQWNWTQADGYRSQSNVSDVALDPLSINAGNYLQYITGFGDFSTTLDVYTSLHKSYQLNSYQKSATIEMPDVGADASSVLWPLSGMSRFDWMASRKPLYQLIAPDTSAAASCIVGQRARLRHKRYTAGAWVYGTVVEWSMDPMAAECSITVMGDPTPLVEGGTNLIIDTIDPTGSVPMWIDQIDGTSETEIDSIGVAP